MADPPRSVLPQLPPQTPMHHLPPFPFSRPAWQTGARASPSFSPASIPARLPPANQGGFPPLGVQANGTRTHDPAQERILPALSGLTVCFHFLQSGIRPPILYF